ncbi:MAG: SRPBCC family protein [Anaerolineae bacterium]|nr:SRPBCC family protein [Anaerolineae bacterium]
MSSIHVEVSDVIDARADVVYGIIADYRVGHPAILPKPYFSDLTVEQGGLGAGTVIRFQMTVMGQTFPFHQAISEPEPGRVLVETDLVTGQTSRFILDPVGDGARTRVTIAADFPASPGLKGLMERLFNPPITRRIFRTELQNLAQYVRRQPAIV